MASILVVDNNVAVRDELRLHLEQDGHEVSVCAEGRKAIELLEKNLPDIMIVDFIARETDGEKLCVKVRNSSLFSTIYIIVLTKKISSTDGLSVGADAYCGKPVVPAEIVAQVRASLRTVEERRSTSIDPLTGLFNRRSFDIFLNREIAEFKRYGRGFSLAFVDVDHFKRINEDHGHDIADRILKDLAGMIRATARPSDLPCRWDGKAFVWLMPQTDLESAKTTANRLRNEIQEFQFEKAGAMTASFGIAVARNGDDTHSLITRAEMALSTAKQSGRNRVVAEGETGDELVESDPPDLRKSTKLRMLVVDDEPHICEFIKVFGESAGFDVDTVTNPQEFPEHYRPDINLITLDLNMPSIDGIELLHFLAENKYTGGISLASAVEDDVLEAAENMALAYGLKSLPALKKPLVEAEVMGVMSQAIVLAETENKNDYIAKSFFPGGSSELPTVEELRSAIENHELEVCFHPQINIKTGTLAGVEALVRWRHPEKGYIPPDYFVPFAEKYKLIDGLTDLVVNKVCVCCQDWLDKWDAFPVSINISESNLGDLNFPETMLKTVQKYGLSPSNIVIELTETSLSVDPVHVLNVLTRLRLKGFQLSIDDYGTGHSSLARLRSMPFRELKIDKMFIDTCNQEGSNQIIVSNTMELAHNLGLKVVAEGVETESQLTALKGLNCDAVQGYYFTKPLFKDDFDKWYASFLSENE